MGHNGEVEVAEELKQLRSEIKARRGKLHGGDLSELRALVRQVNERWNISAHLPITWGGPPLVGRGIAYAKRATRRALRWYINPIVEQQNNYNASVTRALLQTNAYLEQLTREQSTLEQRLTALEFLLSARPDAVAELDIQPEIIVAPPEQVYTAPDTEPEIELEEELLPEEYLVMDIVDREFALEESITLDELAAKELEAVSSPEVIEPSVSLPASVIEALAEADEPEAAIVAEETATEAPLVQAAINDLESPAPKMEAPPAREVETSQLNAAEIAAETVAPATPASATPSVEKVATPIVVISGEALPASPQDPATLYQRGVVYYQSRQYDKALVDFSRALELQPTAEGYTLRGQIYRSQKDDQKALDDFFMALELDPDCAPAYYNCGLLHYGEQRYDDALFNFDEFMRLKPEDKQVYNLRGHTLNLMGRNEEAVTSFGKAIELGSTEADNFFGRANSYYDLNQVDEALADYKRAIEIDSTDYRFFYNRGKLSMKLKDYKAAETDYRLVTILRPELGRGYLKLGTALSNLGMWQDALINFDKAAELGDDEAMHLAAQLRDKKSTRKRG